MYEIGRVYVWQNKQGLLAHLNGTETTVLPGKLIARDHISGEMYYCQPTDSVAPIGWSIVAAKPGDLRPKNPPTGEQKIRSMFEPKPVMEVA